MAKINVDEFLMSHDRATWLMAESAIKGSPPIMTASLCAAIDARAPKGWAALSDSCYSASFVAFEALIRDRWATALFTKGEKAYSAFLGLAGSFALFPAMLVAAHAVPPPVWWKVFGEHWSSTEGARRDAPALRRLLRSTAPEHLAEAMTKAARAELAKMPELLAVWRGCYGINRRGSSWSLDRDIAASFPLLHRYRRPGDEPLLLRGTVRREHALLFLDRNEHEVLSGRVFGITSAPLDVDQSYRHLFFDND